MKKVVALGILGVFLLLSCGAPADESSAEKKISTQTDSKDFAYEKLTEDELQRFIKVYPIARTEMEKAGKRLDLQKSNNPLQGLNNLMTVNKEVAGLDAKMRVAGMSWVEFNKVFSKTWLAVAAYKIGDKLDQSVAQMENQLKNPKLSKEQKKLYKEMLDNIKQTKELYAQVPAENKALVKKYWDKLQALFDID